MSAMVFDEKYILQSVEKAGAVLNLFFQYPELGPSDIAKELGITKGTAFRLLLTLENAGLLIRTEKARYRLSMRIYSLGQFAYNRLNLTGISHNHLVSLVEETGESAFLAISDGRQDIIYLDRALCKSTIRVDITLGTYWQAHCTGVGKAILAFQPESFLSSYLELADFKPVTHYSLTSKEQFLNEIAMIRRSGIAYDNQESEIGLTCYAAPILDCEGHSIAAISICGPLSRMTYRSDEKIDAVKHIAQEISSQVSHS